MRKASVAVGAALALVAGLTGPARAAGAAGVAPPGSRDLTIHPLVSGEPGYSAGTYVWTGYAYNDTGPGRYGSTGGQATYPASAAPGNAANLIQLQLTPTGAGLRVRAVLETLVHPDLPLLGVGFDTDSDPATGAATVPGGRGPPRAASGWRTSSRCRPPAPPCSAGRGRRGRRWRAFRPPSTPGPTSWRRRSRRTPCRR